MPLSPEEANQYAKNKSLLRTRDRNNIAPVPECSDIGLRIEAVSSLQRFCEICFPLKFKLAWSEDHLKAIEIIEDCMVNGGNFAIAMPRGGGKTSLCVSAVLWAILAGHSRFAVLLGATEKAALRLMEDIKQAVSGNEKLIELFPAELWGFKKLENEPRKCKGQHLEGQSTHILWEEHRIKFPVTEHSCCQESVITCLSITAKDIRGTHVTLSDGQTVLRPDKAVCDDVQTAESAVNPETCEKLNTIIESDVGFMAGPTQSVSILFPCTKIAPDDLACRMLDRKLNPEFRGRTFKALYEFPANMELWDEYYSIRCAALQLEGLSDTGDDDDDVLSEPAVRAETQFYLDNRDEMDRGAVVAWPQRFVPKKGEISGLQHCMNYWFSKRAKFLAEYNQEPESDRDDHVVNLKDEDLRKKIISIKRGVVPAWCSQMTCMVDVQGKCLYWMVMAWSADGSGHIVDYGTWPDQRRLYFTLAEVNNTLEVFYGLKGQQEAAIRRGLDDLEKHLIGNEWEREDGSVLRIEKYHVDARWGRMTNVVYEYCRRTRYPTIVAPSMGQSYKAGDTPMDLFVMKPHEIMGDHWMITVGRTARAIPYIKVDSNYWKSWGAQRMLTPLSAQGSVSIFGGKDGRADHRMLFEHMLAEKAIRKRQGNRIVDEWEVKSKSQDNHWWDCYYNNCCAASRLNVSLDVTGPSKSGERKRSDPPPRRVAG